MPEFELLIVLKKNGHTICSRQKFFDLPDDMKGEDYVEVSGTVSVQQKNGNPFNTEVTFGDLNAVTVVYSEPVNLRK